MNETCADCHEPATAEMYAGWLCIGGRWFPMVRPLCRLCAAEDARARAEARAS